MGGVMNIVTRKGPVDRDFVTTNIQLGAGSYGTIQTEASNQVCSGKFSIELSKICNFLAVYCGNNIAILNTKACSR